MSLLDERTNAGSDDEDDVVDLPLGDDGPNGGWVPPLRDDSLIRNVIDVLVVLATCAFVFWSMHPDLLFSDTTPAGGDMGAHVWGFSYLRDTLLPNLRWSGWAPDWYNGFPAFQFYMVVPFVAMVVLNAGLGGPLAFIPVLGALGLVGVGARRALTADDERSVGETASMIETTISALGRQWRWYVAAVVVIVVGVAAPFGVAFKLVSVAGIVAMPAGAYTFGRLARFPFPTPALMAVGSAWFLFDKNFTIYGGNIASTLAGEFAFSISLALSLFYLGVVVDGLRTGRHRGLAAVLLALVGLCHLLPAFFAVGATLVLWVVHAVAAPAVEEPAECRVRRRRFGLLVVALAVLFAGLAAHIVPFFPWAAVSLLLVAAYGLYYAPIRSFWLACVGVTGGLLAAFWVLPFFWTRLYLNDMGWGKIAVRTADMSWWDWFSGEIMQYLVPTGADETPPDSLLPFFVMAVVGAILSIVFRNRIGIGLFFIGIALAAAFMYVPQGRLWNARLLPFWYLVVYLLAAVGVGEIVRAVAQLLSNLPDRPVQLVNWVAAPALLLAFVLFMGAQIRNLPLSSTNPDQSYSVFGLVDVNGRHFVQDWSRWNYSGYEDDSKKFPEYAGLVNTMADIGDEYGCGRSLWEYDADLNSYGTPMAPMLLPHWTDGCIGSQEGLYFEASSTTPFHFLMQSELSQSPSRAQRNMPYRDFDVDAGVEHLQLMGVRYYMTFTAESFEAARRHRDLELIGQSAPWSVFLVADTPLVSPLAFEPAVTTSSEHQEGEDGWLCAEEVASRCSGPALDWFQDSSVWDVALTATGPASWQRVDWRSVPEKRPVTPAVVSDIVETDDALRFRVDRVGSPVLVKTSYFPNWSVSGADGPYRAAPNLMVVVPTAEEVVLTFDRTPIDYLAIALTMFGIALVVLFVRRPGLAVTPLRWYDGAETWIQDPPVPVSAGDGAIVDEDWSSPIDASAENPIGTSVERADPVERVEPVEVGPSVDPVESVDVGPSTDPVDPEPPSP